MNTKTFLEINRVLLERRDLIYIPECEGVEVKNCKERLREVLTLNKNLEYLGYTMSNELIVALCTESEVTDVEDFPGCLYKHINDTLNERTGAFLKYKPMYPGFPEQVMEMDNVELYFNAICHYISGGIWLPEYEDIMTYENKRVLDHYGKLKVIDVVRSTVEYDNLVDNVLKSKTSISDMDKEILKNAVEVGTLEFNPYENLQDICNYKEIICYMQKVLMEKNFKFYYFSIKNSFDTVTDVLRFAVAISDGDISLSENTKFKKFSRPERRLILDAINTVCFNKAKCKNGCESVDQYRFNQIVEEGFNHRMQFIRLGEIVHPGADDMKCKYQLAFKFFDALRNGHVDKYMGMVEKAIAEKNSAKVIKLLSNRPGVFARNLDRLLRLSWMDTHSLVSGFKKVSGDVSNNVLYQVVSHFKTALNNNDDIRVFFPKGNTQKAYVRKDDRINIQTKNCINQIISVCESAIQKHYLDEDRPYLGCVYVNQELDNYIVPFSQRSASTGSRMLTRGSKISFAESHTNVLRSFVHWTNGIETNDKSIIDIDLSASVYDENFSFIEHCSYTRLKSNDGKMVHSGDITNGGSVDGDGVAEFLDFNMDNVSSDSDARYLVFSVYSYSSQPFSSMINVSFGWMHREFVGDNDAIFNPSEVQNRIVLNQNATSMIPIIFDLKEKCFIWTDLVGRTSNDTYGLNNIESTMKGTSSALYAITRMTKTSMMDVVRNNVYARGIFVDNKEDADVIFDLEKGDCEDIKYITPYDIDEWMNLI